MASIDDDHINNDDDNDDIHDDDLAGWLEQRDGTLGTSALAARQAGLNLFFTSTFYILYSSYFLSIAGVPLLPHGGALLDARPRRRGDARPPSLLCHALRRLQAGTGPRRHMVAAGGDDGHDGVDNGGLEN